MQGTLKVSVFGATNVAAMDLTGTSDPYLILKIGEQEQKTKIIMKTLAPVWNEDFVFNVDNTDTAQLELSLVDWNRIQKHSLIGTTNIALSSFIYVEKEGIRVDKALDNNKGLLHMELTPIDFGDTPTEQVENPDMVESRPITNQRGTLRLKLIGASNVAAMDVTGTSDPYVIVKIGEQEHTTKVVKKTLNPTWNDEFIMTTKDVDRDILEMKCFDWNRIQKHSLIGVLNVPLHEMTFKKGHVARFNMNLSNRKGMLHFELSALDFDTTPTMNRRASSMVLKKQSKPVQSAERPVHGRLAIHFKSASQLAAMDVSGTSDPYIIATIGDQEQKTSVIKKTLEPLWNETLTFDIKDALKQNIQLQCVDWNRIQKHEVIGTASISVKDLDLRRGIAQNLDIKLENGQGTLHLSLTPLDFGKVKTETKVSRQGQLFSWGVHTSGQLGLGLVDSEYVYVSEPKHAPFFKDQILKSVAAGHWSSFAITIDGQVYSWGRNTSNQLGQEDTELEFDIPFKIPAFEGIKMNQVAPSFNKSFTAFLAESGKVFVTGKFGEQLYYPPKQIEGLKDVVQISTATSRSGDSSTIYARTFDGSLFAVTSDLQVQKLLISGVTNIHSETKAIAITEGGLYLWNGVDLIPQRDNIKELRKEEFVDALASYKYFVLTSEGKLYEWNQAPVISSSFKDIKLKKIIPGNSYMFGIDENDTVWGYGWNQYGLLGLGEDSRSKRQVSQPEVVKTVEDLRISKLACGLNHNLMIADCQDIEEVEVWYSGDESASV